MLYLLLFLYKYYKGTYIMIFAIVNIVLGLLVLGFLGYILYVMITMEKKLNDLKPAPPTVSTSIVSAAIQPVAMTDIGTRYQTEHSTFATILMSYKNMLIIAQRDSCNALSLQRIATAQQDIINYLKDKTVKWSNIEKDLNIIMNSPTIPASSKADLQRLVALLKKTTVKGDTIDVEKVIELLKNIYTAFCKPQNMFPLTTDAPLKSTLGFQYATDNPDIKSILEIIHKLVNAQMQDMCKIDSSFPDDMTCSTLKQGVNSEIDAIYDSLKTIPNFNRTDFEAQRARIMNVIDSKICNSNPAIEKEQVKEAARSIHSALCVSV